MLPAKLTLRGKRICVVVHYEGMGGAARSLPLRLRALAEEATLEFLVPGQGPAVAQLQPLGEVHELDYGALTFPDRPLGMPGHLLRLGGQARRLRGHFRETAPDLVLTSSMMLPTAVLAARRERIPVLVHCSVLLNEERLPSRLKRSAARLLVGRTVAWADSVVACSQRAADQFEGLGASVEVVYPPIAPLDDGGDPSRLRERHGIPPQAPCVAMIGNITRARGQDVLIRATARLRERLPGIRCLIAGAPFDRPRDIAYMGRLQNLVRGLDLEDAVHFTDVVYQVGEVYAAADVIVNPARVPESFGRVACEALLAGTPVVATRVGAVEEVLENGRNALLVEPDAPEALADAIVATFADPAAAERRTEVGGAEVEARFSPSPLAARFAQIAEEALARTPARVPTAEPPTPSTQPPPTAGAHA